MAWFSRSALFLPCLLAGCLTAGTSVMRQDGKPDALVEDILKAPALAKKPGFAVLSPDVVLQKVPLRTELGPARAAMEQHGFACWPGVYDTKGTCLYCMAFKPRSATYADKIVVKLFYESKRITNVDVIVYYDVPHGDPAFRPPTPTASTPAR